jgi:IS30 family transposase
MGLHYGHLTLSERRTIFQLLEQRQPVAAIAAVLGRHRSTVHREIARNFHHSLNRDRWGHPEGGYFPVMAQRLAMRRRARRAKLVRREDLRAHVLDRLRAGWSPQQIAGRLKSQAEPLACRVSHESIYRYIYGPEGQEQRLYALLACGRRRRRGRFGRKPWRSPIPLEHSIRYRPSEAAGRAVFGHWECDLVIFMRQHGKSNVTSLVERLSRYQVLLANPDRRSMPLIGRIREVLAPLPAPARQTVTFDRGSEFLAYRILPLAGFFCAPQSPWQKGAGANANGRLRRHLPLDSAPGDRSPGALCLLAQRLNDTPRRCLGYRTPAEVFTAQLANLPLQL